MPGWKIYHEMENNQTEISQLGEFGLIDRLTKEFPLRNPETKKGVGDDAAVLSFGDNDVLVTTDLLLEGIHFDLRYVPLKHLGYKAAIVNFSDIYALGCRVGLPWSILMNSIPAYVLPAIFMEWILWAATRAHPSPGLS